MKKTVLSCMLFLSGSIPLNSIAKLHNYIQGSTLTSYFSTVTEIPEFLKQGDLVKITTQTPPGGVSTLYAGTSIHLSGDTVCVSPSVKPYKYELYKWPETIDTDNLRLSLVEPRIFGITTGTAPKICKEYQSGGSAHGYGERWEFVGNGMTATYQVSQIYSAGSASSNAIVSVISGRSEYSEGEIINKMVNLESCFSPVGVTLTTNVKNWCSASVGPGRNIVLDHGEISASEVNNHSVSTLISLSCEGESSNFQLHWLEGQTADTNKIIDIKTGLQTELSIKYLPEGGEVFIPIDTPVYLEVVSVLKNNDINIEPGYFSVSQVLVIDIT